VIPLRDSTRSSSVPVVAYTLIAACTAVFLYTQGMSEETRAAFYTIYGAVPRVVLGGPWPRAGLGLLTYNFLHGSWLHLLGNMLYLWIFADNVEDAMGSGRFIVFYLASGALAALVHIWTQTGSDVPLVGASGAIAGVLGAYLLLYPRARILSVVFFGWFIRLMELPAVLVLSLWFLLQVVEGLWSLAAPGVVTVAFWAHVGGFIVGLALVRPFAARARAASTV
jgi:membrane associated rhomboid family serine protease